MSTDLLDRYDALCADVRRLQNENAGPSEAELGAEAQLTRARAMAMRARRRRNRGELCWARDLENLAAEHCGMAAELRRLA